MISNIRAGILSAIGLMLVNFFQGVFYIPDLNLSKPIIYTAILQVGLLWFSISLWISLRYVLVVLNNLPNLLTNLNWIILNLATVRGLGIIYIIIPNKYLYLVILILGIILFINYIVFFVRIYTLEAKALNNFMDLRKYVISMIILGLTVSLLKMLNEKIWHTEIEYLNGFLSIVPIIFLISFFKHEKKDVQEILKSQLLN